MGIATLVSTSPFLFSVLKWLGGSYLFFLAGQLLFSACQRKAQITLDSNNNASVWRGFFTSFLNPKGLLMYFAILAQFISPDGNPAIQAIFLSLLFITGCGLVYTLVGLSAARAYGYNISDTTRRRLEVVAGYTTISPNSTPVNTVITAAIIIFGTEVKQALCV